MSAQEAGGNVAVDLEAEASEHFVLNAIESPPGLIRGGGGDPVGDSQRLCLAECSVGSIQGRLEPPFGTALEPAIERFGQHAGRLCGLLHGHAVPDVSEGQETRATGWKSILYRERAQLLCGLRKVIDPTPPPRAVGVMAFVGPGGNEDLLDRAFGIGGQPWPSFKLLRGTRDPEGRDCDRDVLRPLIQKPSEDQQPLVVPIPEVLGEAQVSADAREELVAKAVLRPVPDHAEQDVEERHGYRPLERADAREGYGASAAVGEEERLQAHCQRMCGQSRRGAQVRTASCASLGREELIGVERGKLQGLMTLRAFASQDVRMDLANTCPSHRPELTDVGHCILGQALRTDREPMRAAAFGTGKLISPARESLGHLLVPILQAPVEEGHGGKCRLWHAGACSQPREQYWIGCAPPIGTLDERGICTVEQQDLRRYCHRRGIAQKPRGEGFIGTGTDGYRQGYAGRARLKRLEQLDLEKISGGHGGAVSEGQS